MSTDHQRWFLFNASPDIRTQIESFHALQPGAGRATPLQAILLSDAELDHTLGLLLLREAKSIELHATAAVRETLCRATAILRTLEAYCTVTWREVVPGEETPLGGGLSYRAFDVPTNKRNRFGPGREHGRVVGYRLTDETSGRTAVYLPVVQELTSEVLAELSDCDCLLIDGTCWHDDEMIRLGLASKTSRDMGHLPIAGPDGSLRRVAELPAERKIYVHLNNTNPVLINDAPERRNVEQHGIEIASDGLEVRLTP